MHKDTHRIAMIIATYVYHHAQGCIQASNVNSYVNISSCTRIHTGEPFYSCIYIYIIIHKDTYKIAMLIAT